MTKEELEQKEKEITAKIYAIETGVEGLGTVVDGIIDIDRYTQTTYKILWILREAWDSWVVDKTTQKKRMGQWDLVHDIFRNTTLTKIQTIPTNNRVMLVTHKILSDIKDPVEAYKSIAYINVKKIPGGKSSDINEINRAFDKNKEILFEQIEAYDPDIIICGNTLHYFREYFQLDYKKNGHKLGMGENAYYATSKKLYINAFHPSCRLSNDEYVNIIYKAFIDWRDNYKDKE
jgi:hypothetical protein